MVTLAQFHDGNKRREISNISFMFTVINQRYEVENTLGGSTGKDALISVSDMRGRWTDVLVHVNWVPDPARGFLRVYLNGHPDPAYTWSGSTKRRGDNVHFKFGIYALPN